jgi:hypothetical protein
MARPMGAQIKPQAEKLPGIFAREMEILQN